MKKTKIISGTSNPTLAKHIATYLGDSLCNTDVDRFSDGEIRVEVNESVRGYTPFVIQSTCAPVNENVMELLILTDALVRSNVKRVIAVIPYFGYSRQDRRPGFSRTPISSRLVADMLQSAGVSEIVTIDIHSEQQQGFFQIPTTNISATPVFLTDIETKYGNGSNIMFVSPDVGGVSRTRSIAKLYNDSDLAIIDKRRSMANMSEVMNIIGDVNNRHCILVDDIIDTAGTLCRAARALKEKGANKVSAYGTHPVFSGDALTKIAESELDEVVVTNSIPHSEAALPKNVRVLDLAPLLSETIRRIKLKESVSQIYK